jgi:hypothetical protein
VGTAPRNRSGDFGGQICRHIPDQLGPVIAGLPVPASGKTSG